MSRPVPRIPHCHYLIYIKKLSSVIKLDVISKFNISHSHVWEGTTRALTSKSLSPQNKISVKFCDDVGTSEGAIKVMNNSSNNAIILG